MLGHSTPFQQSVPQRGLQAYSLTSEKAQQLQSLCSHTHTMLTCTRHTSRAVGLSQAQTNSRREIPLFILPTRKLRNRGSGQASPDHMSGKWQILNLRLGSLWSVRSDASCSARHIVLLSFLNKMLP